MAAKHVDILPDAEACRALAAKQGDLVSLSSADVEAETELLGATMDRVAIEGKVSTLTSTLKSCVPSLPVDYVVMLREEGNRFTPVLHVYRKGEREISIRIAQKLPDLPAIGNLLRVALRRGFASENFELTSTGKKVIVAGHQIRDIAIVAVPDTHCVVAFLNRRLPARKTGRPSDPGARAPWDTYILKELHRGLHTSPLQISHAVFEREFPRLMKVHPGKWIVYHKDECLGICPTETDAEQLAIDRGIAEEDTYLRLIEEEPPLSGGPGAVGWR